MFLLPAPRSGPLMPGRTAEDGIVGAWDTILHKHCRRAGGMLFFSFPASKKTWTLVCSLLFLEPSWTAQLELIRIEKVKAFRRMSAMQLPVSWMRNQETGKQISMISMCSFHHFNSFHIYGIHDDTEFSELCLCGPGVCESCTADGSWPNLGDSWRFIIRLSALEKFL